MATKTASEQLVDAFEAAIRSGQDVEKRRANLLAWMDGIHKVNDSRADTIRYQRMEIESLHKQLRKLNGETEEEDGRSEADELRAMYPREA